MYCNISWWHIVAHPTRESRHVCLYASYVSLSVWHSRASYVTYHVRLVIAAGLDSIDWTIPVNYVYVKRLVGFRASFNKLRKICYNTYMYSLLSQHGLNVRRHVVHIHDSPRQCCVRPIYRIFWIDSGHERKQMRLDGHTTPMLSYMDNQWQTVTVFHLQLILIKSRCDTSNDI